MHHEEVHHSTLGITGKTDKAVLGRIDHKAAQVIVIMKGAETQITDSGFLEFYEVLHYILNPGGGKDAVDGCLFNLWHIGRSEN